MLLSGCGFCVGKKEKQERGFIWNYKLYSTSRGLAGPRKQVGGLQVGVLGLEKVADRSPAKPTTDCPLKGPRQTCRWPRKTRSPSWMLKVSPDPQALLPLPLLRRLQLHLPPLVETRSPEAVPLLEVASTMPGVVQTSLLPKMPSPARTASRNPSLRRVKGDQLKTVVGVEARGARPAQIVNVDDPTAFPSLS